MTLVAATIVSHLCNGTRSERKRDQFDIHMTERTPHVTLVAKYTCAIYRWVTNMPNPYELMFLFKRYK